MLIVLKALLTAEALVLAWLAYLGLAIESSETTALHVNAGIFATILTVFVHCLVLFYLNGCARAIKHAIDGDADLIAEYVPLTRRLRQRAYPPATFALLGILAAAYSGGWVHGNLIAAFHDRLVEADRFIKATESERATGDFGLLAADERQRLLAVPPASVTTENVARELGPLLVYPVRDTRGWWVHLALLVMALGANVWAFYVEIGVIRENAAGVRKLNAILGERDAA
jgi:hypothetical protein